MGIVSEEYNDDQIIQQVSQLVESVAKDCIDVAWLKKAQIQLLLIYAKAHASNVEILMHFVSQIQYKLNNVEVWNFTQILCSLIHNDSLKNDCNKTACDDGLPKKFLISVLEAGEELNLSDAVCMHRCMHVLSSVAIKDKKLQTAIKEFTSAAWNAFDQYTFLKLCSERGLTEQEQTIILHTVQAYNVPPTNVLNTIENHSLAVEAIMIALKKDSYVDMVDVLNDIELLEEDTLKAVKQIAIQTLEIYKPIEKSEKIEEHITNNLKQAKSILQRCCKSAGNDAPDHENIATAMATLCCVVKKLNGYAPYNTQLVAVIIFVVSGSKEIDRLFRIMTGEGKTLIVALIASILAIQDKHIDVITSNPKLVEDDFQDSSKLFEELGVTATYYHNPDQPQQEVYKHQIVYGTLHNFAVDILHEEFMLEEVRSGRRFDAVIIDEVDMLMLDDGVEITSLEHDSAVLYHLQPVIAAVWTVIGQFSPVITTSGCALYAGSPKLFSDAIFESIDPSKCQQVEDSNMILTIAEQAGVIDELTLKKLMWEDDASSSWRQSIPKSRKKAMKSIKIDNLSSAKALLVKLKECLKPYTFEAYISNKKGILELVYPYPTSTSANESRSPSLIKLLLLEKGTACVLSTKEELKERAKTKVMSSMKFSNEPDSKQDKRHELKLQIPYFIKDLVMNQLQVYIDNAILSLEMVEDREYAITKHSKIVRVDFLNTGYLQLGKKMGGGLQQMLEMKHNLSLSSMSLKTNLISNIGFFHRYKENKGIICGLSGTLGIDSPQTKKILEEMFDVHPCTIPTFKRRKLYEKPAIIVEGEEKEWFDKIVEKIDEAVKEETWVNAANEEVKWRKGQAVLVLCEDIKTACRFREHLASKEDWSKDRRIDFYAENDTDKLDVDYKYKPGELVIATNLASRGTSFKVTDDVNESGGLFCIITFLPRNRRVELQAFGRTARKGKPGSVQCILHEPALDPIYHGLDIKEMREVRSKNEAERLNLMKNTEVKEVTLKEKLFRQHCTFLKNASESVDEQKQDRMIIIESINDNWGQWLLKKEKEIENLKSETKLRSELTDAQSLWPKDNFYHIIDSANWYLSKGNVSKAFDQFEENIQLEPTYAAAAYHDRALAKLVTKTSDGVIDEACIMSAVKDLEEAEKHLQPYIDEVANLVHCVGLVHQLQQRGIKPAIETKTDEENSEPEDTFLAQMQLRMQVFSLLRNKICDVTDKLKKCQGNERLQVITSGLYILIHNAGRTSQKHFYTLASLGFDTIFDVNTTKLSVPDNEQSNLVTGATEILASTALAVFNASTISNCGYKLIEEGFLKFINCDGLEKVITAKELRKDKWNLTAAAGLSVLLAGGQYATITDKRKRTEVTAQKVFENATKYIGEKIGEQILVRKGTYEQTQEVYEEIGKECKVRLQSRLQESFVSGVLGDFVQHMFIVKLPETSVVEDKMCPAVRKRALDFFEFTVVNVLKKLIAKVAAVKEHMSKASSTLLKHLFCKHKGESVSLKPIAKLTSVINEVVADVEFLLEKLIPGIEEACKSTLAQNNSSEPIPNSYSELECVRALKRELGDFVGDTVGNAVSVLNLQQNVETEVTHKLLTVLEKAERMIIRKLVGFNRDLEDIRKGQTINQVIVIPPGDPTDVKVWSSFLAQFTSGITDGTRTSSLLDLMVAVEHYQRSVAIFMKENGGEFVRVCFLDFQQPSSSSSSSTNAIELLYTPSNDTTTSMKQSFAGCFDAWVNGKIEGTQSKDVLEAFANGASQEISVSNVRKEIANHMNRNPLAWMEYILFWNKLIHILNAGNKLVLLGPCQSAT